MTVVGVQGHEEHDEELEEDDEDEEEDDPPPVAETDLLQRKMHPCLTFSTILTDVVQAPAHAFRITIAAYLGSWLSLVCSPLKSKSLGRGVEHGLRVDSLKGISL